MIYGVTERGRRRVCRSMRGRGAWVWAWTELVGAIVVAAVAGTGSAGVTIGRVEVGLVAAAGAETGVVDEVVGAATPVDGM